MKFTGTKKAMIKEANKFSKINFKKSSSASSIYKTSSPAGIENEREFFGHQNVISSPKFTNFQTISDKNN